MRGRIAACSERLPRCEVAAVSPQSSESALVGRRGRVSRRPKQRPQAHSTNSHLLSYIQALNGNRITLAYTNGLATSVADTFGNTIVLADDSLGHILQTTHPESRVTTYTYDIKNDSQHSTLVGRA